MRGEPRLRAVTLVKTNRCIEIFLKDFSYASSCIQKATDQGNAERSLGSSSISTMI